MNEKLELKSFELFDELPLEIQCEVAQNLSTPDLAQISTVSKKHWNLFKPLVNDRKLLPHVVCGNHDMVNNWLKNDLGLIFKRGKVTDCSGRIFEHISAFEYALWALDKHMWTLMLNCIPANEEGKKVLEELLCQYNHVNTVGVIYEIGGTIIREKHFDFENTLFKELQTQVDLINATGPKDLEIIKKQWREGVGGAQKLLPMHVVDEYCSKDPFYPLPTFTLRPESSREFFNWKTNMNEYWWAPRSRLGIDYAIVKAGLGWGVGTATNGGLVVSPGCALTAVKTLYKVRTNDFIGLKSQLEKLMTVDNQPPALQI